MLELQCETACEMAHTGPGRVGCSLTGGEPKRPENRYLRLSILWIVRSPTRGSAPFHVKQLVLNSGSLCHSFRRDHRTKGRKSEVDFDSWRLFVVCTSLT